MTRLEKLRNATSLRDLAHLLGFQPSSVSYLLYVLGDANKYTTFYIDKSDGGYRTIKAPHPKLKHLQSRLAEYLQDCLVEIEKNKNTPNSLSHGFRRHHSIITNAYKHRGKKYVFNLDLKDFFGSINFGRVRGYFINDYDFSLNESVATVIAQIACHNNSLPQGSPVSPVISNLIGHILDVRLVRLAKKNQCTYSRYADDITFSNHSHDFPSDIAVKVSVDNDYWEPGKKLEKIINNTGFTINPAKNRMLYRGFRQDVTGLTVNVRVNTKKKYWRDLRSMVNRLFNQGNFYIKNRYANDSGEYEIEEVEGTRDQIKGMLGFVNQVEDFHKNNDKKSVKHLSSKQILYKRFIYYDKFYSNENPIIIGEGVTDSIYIKTAIKSLHAKFPKLVRTEDDRLHLNVDFFSYTKTARNICKLSGGTGDIATFINEYKTYCKKYFKYPNKPLNPVIILIDNDDGAKNIFSIIKSNNDNKTPVYGEENYYHVAYNLYVVAIPKLNNKSTAIEDLFDQDLLKKEISGKTFNKNNNYDSKYHYGKYVFSKKIILPAWKEIDFSNFEMVLNRIQSVIDLYN